METKMPDKWIPLKGEAIAGDVLRWKEPVWPLRKKKKPEKLGEHQTTGAVLTVDSKGFVRVSVMNDEIIANKYGMPLKTLKKDEVITKKIATIMKGAPERRQWSDESARALAVSRFFS